MADLLDSSNTSPEILYGLTNKTAVLGSTAIFHCRVHSRVSRPSIKWLRKLNRSWSTTPAQSNRSIQYNNETFELMESSGERLLGDNIYVSKLILQNIGFKDAGAYDCLAFNYHGFQKQEIYLSVILPDKLLTQYRTEPNLMWLLLIPILFITLPIFIWMCFFANKEAPTTTTKELPLKTKPYMIVNVEIV